MMATAINESTLKFLIRSGEHPHSVMNRMHPDGETLLNSTEWRGKPPRSCAIRGIHAVTGGGHVGAPNVFVDVVCRPKGFKSYVGHTEYDGWDAVVVDRKSDGTLLDGKGLPLPDGQRPVTVQFRAYRDMDFNAIDFGEFIGEVETQPVKKISVADFDAEFKQKTRSFNATVKSSFFAHRRQRPTIKIIVCSAPSQSVKRGSDHSIVLSNSEPHFEERLMETVRSVLFDFIGGIVSLPVIEYGDVCFVQLDGAVVDCTPNEHDAESWFNMLSAYTPIGFLEELAKRAMANFWLEATVVEGSGGGLLLKLLSPRK